MASTKLFSNDNSKYQNINMNFGTNFIRSNSITVTSNNLNGGLNAFTSNLIKAEKCPPTESYKIKHMGSRACNDNQNVFNLLCEQGTAVRFNK